VLGDSRSMAEGGPINHTASWAASIIFAAHRSDFCRQLRAVAITHSLALAGFVSSSALRLSLSR
jgi:hypothetical protein